MVLTTTFDSTKEILKKLLEKVQDGSIQLPEFQREWVWEDERIKSLLASVSLSYPIGTLMLLQTGNPDVRFKARPIQGAPSAPSDPERMLLDGQQRMTSLYQVLASGEVVRTQDDRKKPIQRWYYIDINVALDPAADRDEAIISVPRDSPSADASRDQARRQHSGVGVGACSISAAPRVRRLLRATKLATGFRQTRRCRGSGCTRQVDGSF